MPDVKLPRLIVAGTDTGVGKTVLSALLTAALDACYWKPVQSGLDDETDSEAVLRMASLPPERIFPEAYRLTRPLSPDQSSSIDGVTITLEALRPPDTRRCLVIEGAGGLHVPFNDTALQIDFFARLRAPVVLAARSGLGTLNHTLLSLEALRMRAIRVAGIVLIGPENRGNMDSLERWASAPIVGLIPPLDVINRAALLDVYRQWFIPIERWKL